MPPPSSPAVRPLLKWAGGKRQLLPALRRYYPAAFCRYVEPFLGSGAVFFDLYSAGRLRGPVRLADSNPDLIGCYTAVRDRTEAVIAALRELEREHRVRGSECYYDVRDRRFNPMRLERSPRPSTGSGRPEDGEGRIGVAELGAYPPELAAMFIYLNRTGFNGLYRLNRNGGFNVPAGRYANPTICDAPHVRAVAQALSAANVTLQCLPFEKALTDIRAGDFVYCDPPYAPLSATASFAHYTAGGFTLADHRRLQAALMAAAARGAAVLLSNSSAPQIERAYRSGMARDTGLVAHRVPARRAINSRASLRGPVDELIVSNTGAAAAAPVPVRMLRSRLRAGEPHQLAATGTGKGEA